MPMLDDDTLITPALLRRFIAEARLEAGNGQHYAFVRRSNGNLIAHNPASPEIAGYQTMFAADVLKVLNRELHHDGAWVVVFTHPEPPEPGSAILLTPPGREYARYVLMWLDRDGDVQFSVEWVKNESELLDFAEVLEAGIDSVVEKCEGAWQMWHLHMREVLDPREGETFQRARGQMPSSARH